jgi:hypothetical protein
MDKTLKSLLERTTLLGTLARRRRRKRLERKYSEWKQKGSVLPMPHLGKQRVLTEYTEKFSPAVFIETGTYKGDMVYAMLDQFEEIFSIELDRALFEKAQRRFSEYSHVHIMHGQSGELLPAILRDVTQPCLFWLDAHWSGGSTAKGELETPIIQELQCILNHTNAEDHIILIDDARCFKGGNDYPTLETLEHFVLDIRPGWIHEVKDDIIRIYSNNLSNELPHPDK